MLQFSDAHWPARPDIIKTELKLYVNLYISLTSVRLFLRQLVLSCPQEYYESLLCPLLGPLFGYMLQVRISTSTVLFF